MRLQHLAICVLEQHRARAVDDAEAARRKRRGMAARGDAVARGLNGGKPYGRLADEPTEQPDRVRPTANAGDDEVGQPTLCASDLRRCLVTDHALEVAHDRGIRVRTHRRAEDVVRVGDVGDPVTHGLVDGVLERR